MATFDSLETLEFIDSELEKRRKEVLNDKVIHIQKKWGDWLILIGKVYKNNGDYSSTMNNFLNDMYENSMLFKPTMAKENIFRKNTNECKSYFIGGGDIDEDKGFALNAWQTITWFNNGIIHKDKISIAMGHYIFKNKDKEVKAEYTFVYEEDIVGNLKIIAHHSSLPI